MIALNLSQDRVTKIKFRAASLELASRVLRDGGLTEAADHVDRMAPDGIRRVPRDAAVLLSGYVRDSDMMVRSTRRSGFRYVAHMLRLAGVHADASRHLERAADAIPLAREGVASSRRVSERSCGACS